MKKNEESYYIHQYTYETELLNLSKSNHGAH